MVSAEISVPVLTITGSLGVVSAALALGIRHGIDWDHIAAITDITSTTAALDEDEAVLVREPALMLTDESHHAIAHEHEVPPTRAAGGANATDVHAHEALSLHHPHHHQHDDPSSAPGSGVSAFAARQRPALLLGTMYALGHGSIVLALGLVAILARQVLPDWIDPIMGRVVGFTLLFLAFYLFYSLYRYFRGEGEFQMRSRWMLVFAGIRNGWEKLRSKLFGGEREHEHAAQQYGVHTALGIGMIHGVGAETGTQALVIASAVGAASQAMGVVALVAFIVGLLISNSVVTVVSTAGFVSSRQRQWMYVGAGMLAAIFSLVLGLIFLFEWSNVLPGLDPYFRWIGGPD
jgi:high-affinity nickel-transport protein